MADDGMPPETVIEFGPEPVTGTARRRRRPTPSGLLAALAADPRVVPLSAVLAGVAGFASLISEWQITTFQATPDDVGRSSYPPQAVGVADLGALGTGYLIGLLVLVGAVVLVMYGPAAGRRHARLLGFTAGGFTLAVLAAIGSDVGKSTRAIDRVFTLDPGGGRIELSYGRGLWCALFALAAAVLTLVLAERHAAPAAVETGGAPAGEPAPAWSWRRPHETDDRERPADEPLELTVGPARPFTSLTADRDKGGGISG